MNERMNCSPGASTIQWSVPRPTRLTQGSRGSRNSSRTHEFWVVWILKELASASSPLSAAKGTDIGSMSLGLHAATPIHSSLSPIPIVWILDRLIRGRWCLSFPFLLAGPSASAAQRLGRPLETVSSDSLPGILSALRAFCSIPSGAPALCATLPAKMRSPSLRGSR